jgi:hypothetical protein
MFGEIIALISILIALTATLLTLWQNILTRRALQAQSLLTLRDLALQARFPEALGLISALKDYGDFDAYMQETSEDTRKLILDAVEYLNFAAHLVDENVLPRQTLYNFYFWAYRTSNEKLGNWWLEGYRRNYPQRFRTFERMCTRVASVSDAKIAEFERKHHELYIKKPHA